VKQRCWSRSLLFCLSRNKGGLSCRWEGYAPRQTVKQLARLRSRDTSDTDDDKAPCRWRAWRKEGRKGGGGTGNGTPLLADIYGLQQPLSGAAVRIGAGYRCMARATLAPRMPPLFSLREKEYPYLGYWYFYLNVKR